MNPTLLLIIVLAYFGLLLFIAWITSRGANNESFFIGNRNSKWWLVAFGMIGTSLSGVTFVSVPGTVNSSGMGYFQVVIGYFLGYFLVAFVLLPLYYRMKLTSIYTYLEHRFGMASYKTGALFFILSRTVGATARLYLVINVLQIFILDALGVPFFLTAFVILLLILLYTFEGGVKTIVYTDTLQTTFMLLGLIVCIVAIMNLLQLDFGATMQAMQAKGFTRIFNTDPNSGGFFLKQILGGAFITVAMTGLDQEMMQKNISVSRLGDSQKNMLTFSTIMVVVNFLFLLLGGLLYLFADANGLTQTGDNLFPTIALSHLSPVVSLLFIIGLISALFPSADGAITALTSSFCIDILGIRRREGLPEKAQTSIRRRVHLSFALVFLLCILIFKAVDNHSIINVILKLAGFTYGPLLGLFAFGILSKRKLRDSYAPLLCIIALLLTIGLDVLNGADWYAGLFTDDAAALASAQSFSESIFGKYKIGIELLLINAGLTYLLLFLFSGRPRSSAAEVVVK